MGKGISLHIGLNYVDPEHYGGGWDGKLNACEFDARDMGGSLAGNVGFSATSLLREKATRAAVIKFLKNSAEELNKGDMLFVSYSGHGGQVPDQNSDEDDAVDETWCLFDGQLVDDELANLWAGFKEGVRILVLSDSCHSGTISKYVTPLENESDIQFIKCAPDEIVARTYERNKDFYDDIASKNAQKGEIKCHVKLISGCQDNQYSYDGAFNGQFTARVKKVWNGGNFHGDYAKFHKKIVSLLPARQTPNYYNIGMVNSDFDSQKPFTI